MLHRISHWLWTTGHVVTWWRGSRLFFGFFCDTCGKVDAVQDTGIRRPSDAERHER